MIWQPHTWTPWYFVSLTGLQHEQQRLTKKDMILKPSCDYGRKLTFLLFSSGKATGLCN
jgi:hypothetical protein